MLYEFKENLHNIWAYICKKRFSPKASSSISIGFICGFHGKTGGPIAIASIANGLSKEFNVSFETYPTSFYNRLLNSSVIFEKKVKENKDIYFFDLSANVNELRKKKDTNCYIILTIHGLRFASHSLPSEHINEMLALADKVHFVGQVQQDSYQLPKADYFIIPNSANPVTKDKITNNIGVVGNLDAPKKNAALSVEIGLRSRCNEIHLWSTNILFSKDIRVVHHEWENNRDIIYGSFDILVFLSQQETFGLVIAEALSAGIPCILSNIDAFVPFKNCPGVVLVKDNEIDTAHLHINRLLLEKEALKPLIQDFFNKHFSQSTINKRWNEKILELTS